MKRDLVVMVLHCCDLSAPDKKSICTTKQVNLFALAQF